MNKYELLKDDTIQYAGKTLYRIKALTSFGVVKAGDLGGYIEKEANLSHTGDAWVCGNAEVYDNAWVYDNAEVYGNAKVCGNAWVSGNAEVYDNAKVCGNAWVSGNAEVYDNAKVCGNARVCGDAWVYDNARVCGDAEVSGDARVHKINHIVCFSNVGRENGTLTVYAGEEGLIATRGCFCGTVDEFLAKSAEVHDEKTKREYQLLIEVAKSRILGE